MTTRELLTIAGQSPEVMALILAGPPVLALVLGLLLPRGAGGRSPYKYAYSLAVFGACIPGVAASVVDAYTLFFTRENLLDANFLVAIAPIASMVLTLGLVRRSVAFQDLPGFDRLSGLVLMLAVTFASVIVVSKMHFAVLFRGSLWGLLAMGVAIFLAVKYGAHLAFGRKRPRYD